MSNIQEPVRGFDSKVFAAAGKSFYLNEKAADVHFVLKCGRRIPAHKLLLIAVSEEFDTNFNGPAPEEGYVEMVDASAAAFEEFLQFFYLNKVQLTMENIDGVMNLANKYGVLGCLDSCQKFLQSNLTVDTVCQIYDFAITHAPLNLKLRCEVEISRYTEMVFKSAGFLACSEQVLEHILKLDHFSCSEVDVFKACMSWVQNATEQDELTRDIVNEHLGYLLFGIRFRSMTLTKFVDLVPAYGKIFTANEYCEILQIIQNKEYEPKQFSGDKRFHILKWNENAVIQCDRFLDSDRPYLIENVDITQFNANKQLLLGKVSCEAIFKNDNKEVFATNVPAEVIIATVPHRTQPTTDRKILYNEKFELNNNAQTVIEFPTSIFIRAGVKYEISLDLQQSVYSDRELKTEVQFGSDVKVKFHNDKGLISSLYFNQVN